MSRSRSKETGANGVFGSGAVVPPVSAAQLGVGFTLFRRAALEEETVVEDLFQPLSDRYALATLSDKGLERGMSILKIHYDHPDVHTSSMRRIASFVGLLRAMNLAADPAWARFAMAFDSFAPILQAISWCSVHEGESFDPLEFMRIAESAPLRISYMGDFLRRN